ncbi:class I SAM-dependent methyltransferase [Laspinema olomoucense]|uniref:class I SAM-dependent methyltransferase n=1 Tax=Laspinema olomoucense TaxID=3231600 RepID=UPI0021BB44CE|nr:class I SAM-dependent methyltransferase [Laspinema sp. D3d]MCT7974882.1 class I SAM-dependent methyltransferase [Laspinema sp. D3d]
MNIEIEKEKKLQETFTWARSKMFADYNGILGYYQAKSCLEYARGRSLLDMPCGDGTLTSLLSNAFETVVGIDASSQHLALAKINLPNAHFHEALIEDFDTTQKFDTITMLNILEHVVDPITILRKAVSLLNDDGVLIVHVPNANAINRRLAVLMGTLTHCEELSPFDIQVAGHRRSYTMKTLLRDIKEAELCVFATGGVFYKSLSTPQMNWFLENGLWEEGGFGWGRVGSEEKDWKSEFCRASYELGKQHPEDCNIIYACMTKQ